MTRKSSRPEGLLERLARGIVADELGVPVDRYDDGTADAQPDGMIRLRAGDAPLEVVSDEDSEYASQADALDKHGRRIQGLDARAWYVTVHGRADRRQLQRDLPRLLEMLQPGPFHTDYNLTDELVALGVTYVNPFPSAEPGTIYLSHQGWSSWENRGELNAWILDVLAREDDVGAKLAAFGGIERHAFIWARPSSPWDVNAVLRGDDDLVQVPVAAPVLPDGITHVWAASTMTRRGCLVAHDGRWRRTRWITTEAAE